MEIGYLIGLGQVRWPIELPSAIFRLVDVDVDVDVDTYKGRGAHQGRHRGGAVAVLACIVLYRYAFKIALLSDHPTVMFRI